MGVLSQRVIGLCTWVMGTVTVLSPWSRGRTSDRGRCHVMGYGHGAVHGCLGCRAREFVNVNLYETNVYPPDFEIPAVVGCVAEMVCETNASPPDS